MTLSSLLLAARALDPARPSGRSSPRAERRGRAPAPRSRGASPKLRPPPAALALPGQRSAPSWRPCRRRPEGLSASEARAGAQEPPRAPASQAARPRPSPKPNLRKPPATSQPAGRARGAPASAAQARAWRGGGGRRALGARRLAASSRLLSPWASKRQSLCRRAGSASQQSPT